MQVVHVLILAIYITVYGFAQPYKSRLANILETAVNLNFLFLLIINATSFFNSDLFTFSSISESTSDSSSVCPASIGGVALVSWILMPVYYLPLIGLCITAAVLATLFLRCTLHVCMYVCMVHNGIHYIYMDGHVCMVHNGIHYIWTFTDYL